MVTAGLQRGIMAPELENFMWVPEGFLASRPFQTA
jgi:hypothetical protein